MALENPQLMEVIKAIKSFRLLSQFKNLYADTFRLLCDEQGFVHPNYNQIVRTGRMSSRRPNSQQQNEQSKALIHPDDGGGFISCDYSQIEFRLIVHYIKDMLLTKDYNENPDTDFHQWVADLMHVTRKVGKTLNFGMAYGAGKRTVIRDLTANPDIIEEMSKIIVALIAEGKLDPKDRDLMYAKLCAEHTEKAYNTYHERIPGLRDTSRRAQAACAQRGYIFNAYGRRRHLPERVSYKAFNSLIQSCAMDLIKERMVSLSPRFNSETKKLGIKIAANVHDEIVFKCPLEILHSEDVKKYIITELESPAIQFRVPIRTGYGVGEKHWAEACYGH
jgi:DNA polymerase-1